MFFIGIFGVETKENEIKDINNIICKSCGRISTYKLIKQYDYFHFFFVPIFKWNERYYLISRCCNAIFEVSKEVGQRLETEENPNINDFELHEMDLGYNIKKCPNCNLSLYEDYNYCPHCGFKLK